MRAIRALLALALVVALGTTSVGCRQKMVTVKTGEIVLCTYGEVVSDTTTEKQVPANEVGKYGVKTRIETCDLHKKLEALYRQAQDAITAGDLASAGAKLKEIVALDPTYRKAGQQLADIDAGKKPAVDSGSSTPGGSTTPTGGAGTPGEDEPTGPVLNLAKYVPDTLEGFVGQGLVADPFALTREYLPTGSSGPRHLVIVAEQFKDAAGARAELDASIKTTYPDSVATVSIGGKDAYFGVRKSVAVVAIVDGSVLVVAEGSTSGDDAASLKNALVNVAQQIAQ